MKTAGANGPKIAPPLWPDKVLDKDRAKAMEVFRHQRMEEPLEQYVRNFDDCQAVVEELLETTVDLSDLDENLVEVLTDPKLLEAFRYLAGPPISDDDLKVLAEAVLSRTTLTNDAEMVRRIRQVVLDGLDRRRFPWVIDGREPTETERTAAVIASAALIATRKLETNRRSEGKLAQETAVHKALGKMGFKEVKRRTISTFDEAPNPGEFCQESLLGTRKADVVVRLHDKRVMPIECKVSNSSTNSVKRLNNDAARKAETWKQDFGQLQIVPAAVLSGVFKLHNLKDAQNRGLCLFWAHNLKAMTDWIERAR